MDDLQFGQRNKRGDWSPSEPLAIAPYLALPPNPIAVLKFLPAYLLPWNLLFFAATLLYWRFVLPPVETMKTLQPGWILTLFAVNCVAIFLFYNAFEYRLYRSRAQGVRFKYNAQIPRRRAQQGVLVQQPEQGGLSAHVHHRRADLDRL